MDAKLTDPKLTSNRIATRKDMVFFMGKNLHFIDSLIQMK